MEFVGERPAGFAADLDRIRGGHLIDQGMLHRGKPPPQLLAAPQQRQALPRRQRVEVQVQRPIQISRERVEHLDDRFPTIRTHVLIVATPTDKKPVPKLL